MHFIYKRLEHPWVLVSEGVLRINPPKDTKELCIAYEQFKSQTNKINKLAGQNGCRELRNSARTSKHCPHWLSLQTYIHPKLAQDVIGDAH
jgi:hypothetical protein